MDGNRHQTTNTQMKEGFADMLKIVSAMLMRPECDAFRAPVDWKALELFDYPEIVKCKILF